ncbi:hypothetical protein V7112_08400 [Bacillus sp. JJ1566]|uniref:hypothetical protein n=1 Tax=Bacillus sp. JJ1566 TaxID=3122961 RepID=UPI002FFE6E4C
MIKDKYYLYIIILILLLILTACNPDNFSDFTSKEEISNEMKKEDYTKIIQFIIDSLNNKEKSELVEFTITEILKLEEKEEFNLIKNVIIQLVRYEDYEKLKTFTKYLSINEEKYYNINNSFNEIVEPYVLAANEIPEIQVRLSSLSSERLNLMDQIPYKIPLEGKIPEPFSGIILQKIDSNTYRITHNVVSKEFILKTFETEFTSQGSFNLTVIQSGIETIVLQNGFEKDFEVLYEIPKSYESQINQIVKITNEMGELEDALHNYESIVSNFDNTLGSTIDAWSPIGVAQEKNNKGELKEVSKTIPLLNVSQLKEALTLGLEKQVVINLIGKNNDEIDMEYYPHPDWIYSNDQWYLKISWNEDWTIAEYTIEYDGEGDTIIQYNKYSDGTEEERFY